MSEEEDEREGGQARKKDLGRKKARGMKNVLSLSVGWRNTAWLATVNTENTTTTTNHRLPGTDTHTQRAKPVLLAFHGHTATHRGLLL